MAGDSPADDALFPRVYAELKALAKRQMARERPDHTLQATALVNEAWMRLRDQVAADGGEPARFYLAAAESMRRILIDHARKHGRDKRGGSLKKLPLDLVDVAETLDSDQILAVGAAIDRLKSVSERAADVVRLRFFAGLTEPEAANALEISERTVRREWTFARAWLYNALAE